MTKDESGWESERLNEMEEVAEKLEKFVNSFSFPAEEFADRITQRTHRTLQQSIMRIVIALLQRWSDNYEKGIYDLRNEDTCKLADKMIKGAGDDLFLRMV